MGALEDTKLEVLRATDIVALVEQYVPLTRAGRSYKALCPFHNEKTPSFHVSSERGTFKCFGCQKRGNAIDFLMEKDKLDFMTAFRVLAERAGIRLPERGARSADGGAAAARLDALELNKLAQAFFRESLLRSREGEAARAYVESRGITEESADRFGIGYAPRRGNFLLRYLVKRGWSPARVVRAGLAGDKGEGRGPFDWFRGRLMFPIHDVTGKVVGFGGRALEKDQAPKYMNSPETPAFRKSEIVYGLHLARDAAHARGEVAIVEGYTDVILAHQAGFPWFVAPLGTAFTVEQARTLSRVAQRLLVFFDGDAAGAAANRKTIVEVGRAGIGNFKDLRVASLPDGLDPADLIVRDGPAALGAAVDAAMGLADFFAAVGGTGTADRTRAVEELCEVFAGLDSDTRREIEIASAAHRFGLPEELVRRHVKAARERALNKQVQAASKQALGAAGAAAAPAPAVPEPGLESLPRAERWALEALIAVPDLVADARERVPLEAFSDPRARAVAEAIYAGHPISGIGSISARKIAADVEASIDPAKNYGAEWRGIVARLVTTHCDKTGCTNDDTDELKDSVARKLRQLALQKREMGLRAS